MSLHMWQKACVPHTAVTTFTNSCGLVIQLGLFSPPPWHMHATRQYDLSNNLSLSPIQPLHRRSVQLGGDHAVQIYDHQWVFCRICSDAGHNKAWFCFACPTYCLSTAFSVICRSVAGVLGSSLCRATSHHAFRLRLGRWVMSYHCFWLSACTSGSRSGICRVNQHTGCGSHDLSRMSKLHGVQEPSRPHGDQACRA